MSYTVDQIVKKLKRDNLYWPAFQVNFERIHLGGKGEYIDDTGIIQQALNTLMKNEKIYFMFIPRCGYTSSTNPEEYVFYILTDKCRLIESKAESVTTTGFIFSSVSFKNTLDIYDITNWYDGRADDFELKKIEKNDYGTESITIGRITVQFPHGKYKGFISQKLVEEYHLLEKVYNKFLDCVREYYRNEKSAAAPREPKIATGAPSIADELIKYKSLLDSGAITPAEFEILKAKLING